MKIDLLPSGATYYKANLHCHSTFSDGWLTPAQIKERYKAEGYSIVAFTDHEVCFSHQDLADEAFLPITGYEMQINGETPETGAQYRRVVHLNFYAKTPENTTLVCYCPEEMKYATHWWYVAAMHYRGKPVKKRILSTEGLNAIISAAREQGFLVSFCHPYWSLNDRRDYCGLEGLFALEIYNATCGLWWGEYNGYCPQVYDEMLRDGQRIACIAGDDNHNKPKEYIEYQLKQECELHDPRLEKQSYGGWTMIAARQLEYGSIIEAMEQGNCYTSRGPQIKALYVENGVFHIECSPAKVVLLSSGGRRRDVIRYDQGAPITHATFGVEKEDLYVRFTVVDYEGKTADTRAYWPDEYLISSEKPNV